MGFVLFIEGGCETLEGERGGTMGSYRLYGFFDF